MSKCKKLGFLLRKRVKLTVSGLKLSVFWTCWPKVGEGGLKKRPQATNLDYIILYQITQC